MVLALATLGAPAANAEDGAPMGLLLENGVKGLTGELKGGVDRFVTLSGKEVTDTSVTATLQNCKGFEGSEKDTNLCEGTIDLLGVKQGKVLCRSENAKGEKDPIETILVAIDLELASGETAAKTLVPLGLGKVLGQSSGEEELKVNCGGVKDLVRGVLACELGPGLTNIATTEEGEIRCKFNNTTHDQEVPMCVRLCEWLKEHPFEGNLGAGFEDASIERTVKGKFNKDVFADD
jgi:hypothetical protein